ncbi:hypothetical protein BLNAU_5362 [Blattamonas nauphoetae]|uniref:Uncharacterized protein n=1 Tax=Blattamonas nauphoetae TaxID=2049346 RepID=A0ABQ9Y7C0_9EUKA|nr:hypothetical protein BLNAU_5362 [Blattamonas nauphoetae]
MKFLESFVPDSRDSSADDLLACLASIRIIPTAAMKMLQNLVSNCSARNLLTLVKADLIPELIDALNPPSLSFTEAGKIHTYLFTTIAHSIWLATPNSLSQFGIQDSDEQQAVHETFTGCMAMLLEEWYKKGGDIRRSGTILMRCFRMEGIEDVTEQRLHNEETTHEGQHIADESKWLSIFFGMNIAPPA